jgi:sugar transferase (PEP-CTERM system associated)
MPRIISSNLAQTRQDAFNRDGVDNLRLEEPLVATFRQRSNQGIRGLFTSRDRVYVLGSGPQARTVVELLRTRGGAGMELVGWKEGEGNEGQRSDFAADLRSYSTSPAGIDRVIVAMEDRRGTVPIPELLDLRFRGVIVESASSVLERLTGRLALGEMNPSAFIFSDTFKVHRSQQVIRRMISVPAALAGLLLCLPFIPFIMLAIRLSSAGPVFFSQTRVGLRGHLFTAFKFRTMRDGAEEDGAAWAIENDPRVTPLGRFMRATRLDEIPQLWNVLRGDMGFIGPRPERPEFVQWLSKDIPYYDLRHMIRPGITGWAQVRYGYSATLEESKMKLEYDLYYLKHLSLGLDLLILVETFKTVILRRGAR